MLRKTIFLFIVTTISISLCGPKGKVTKALSQAAVNGIRLQLTSRLVFCSQFTNPCQRNTKTCACINLRNWLSPTNIKKAIADANSEIAKIHGRHKVIE